MDLVCDAATSQGEEALQTSDDGGVEQDWVEGGRFCRYDIVGELGRGGMGVIYRAIDTQLKRPVALKVLLVPSRQMLRQRMRKEAEVVAKLQHPGIVQIFEVGTQSGKPYIALELVEGG